MPVSRVQETRYGQKQGTAAGDGPSLPAFGNTLATSQTGFCTYDDAYIEALRAGDPDVENHLISQFSTAVRAKLRARLRSPELVEDAYQETFLRVLGYFQSGKTLNKAASLPGFVHSICHNVALELLRQYTKQDQIPEHHPGVVDERPDAQDQLVTEERKTMVRQILDELSENDSRVLKRIFLDEEDRDTVCRELDVDRNYLRLVVFRARRRFRDVLESQQLRAAAARR